MSETTAAAKARILNEVRDKFGVSIHSNMDLKTLIKQWKLAIQKDAKLASKFPALAASMAAAEAQTIIQDQQIKANVIAKEATNTATIITALISSFNPITPNPSYPTTEGASKASALALKLETIAINSATDKLIEIIDSLPSI